MTRTERTYYVVFGLYSTWAWFVAPFYPLFLASRGLDPFEVNLVLATYLLIICFFEVPTGAAADRLGRKASFVTSCLVRAAAFGLYATASSFSDCVVAELIDGVGTTLANGALDAWAVDGMRAEGDERAPDRFFARAQVVMRTVMIGGGLACTQLATLSYALPWWVAAGGFLLTAGAAAMLMHAPAPSSASERATFLRTMREGVSAVRDVPVLQLVCLLTAAAFFAAVPAHMLWQARMVELSGEGVAIVGWMWVALNLAAMTGSAILPRMLARVRRERVICAAVAWRGVTLAIAAAATTLSPALAGWLLQEVSYGVSEPVLQSWMNEHVPPGRRATALSVRSMVGTLGGGAGLVAIGLVARDYGTQVAWAVSAMLFLLTAPAYLRLGRQAVAKPIAAIAESV